MTLINIEYGSIASSETMNKNFSYLEEKINNTSDSIMTSISSILSNIATINTRLSEMSELINENDSNMSSKIEEYKNKTKILVQASTMLPHWNGCCSITINERYSVSSNGYILIIPTETSSGTIKINSTELVVSSKLILLPVKEGDVITTSLNIDRAFFLPVTEISIESF